MKNKPELIVLDTCVYVDALFVGHARHKDSDEKRMQRSLNLLESLDEGKYIAGLLPIVLVELNSSRQLGDNVVPRVKNSRKNAIDEYFNGVGHITLEHDDRVAKLGARLARETQMKGPDAIVAASAVVHEAHALYSWDDKILRLHGHPLVRGLNIQQPPAKVKPTQASIYDLLSRDAELTKRYVSKIRENDQN